MSTVARGAIFVGVLLVVLGGAFALADGGSPTPTVEGEPEAVFTGDDMAATVPTEEGTVSLSADAAGKTVAIDAAHGNAPSQAELAPMVSTLTENGAEVTFTSARRPGSFNATLRSADAFVTFGADRQYTPGQTAAVKEFTEAGGRLLVLTEPDKQSASGGLFFPPVGEEGISTPLTPLLNKYGVATRDGYLFNMANYDNNYVNVYGTPAADSSLTEGVDELVFHESVALVGGESVVTAGDQTTLSSTREAGTYGVVTRTGENAVFVGDTSVLGSEFVRRSDNEQFTSNLLAYLVTGEKAAAAQA